ncbi:hypothetical protein GJ744_006784 [Endocarpon pusillum]|uniref:Uncharacterized protein n=1 Tax=Endocarpon pusillum TaxID=364733 RepID=A0A8H7AJK0_9EURO|nr:hypothetical protein GJ744_006784 [Endocarpon pusillum]
MQAQPLTWTWEDRYYIRFKVIAWVSTFGGRATQFHQHGTYHITAPRRPNKDEIEWLKDADLSSSVQVPGYGTLQLPTEMSS